MSVAKFITIGKVVSGRVGFDSFIGQCGIVPSVSFSVFEVINQRNFSIAINRMKAVWILFWRHLRPALLSPSKLVGLALRVVALLKARGLRGALEKFSHSAELYDEYPRWVALYDTPTGEELTLICAGLSKLTHAPRISLLMQCAAHTDRQTIRAIESIQAQIYHNWEICIAITPSSDHACRKALGALAVADVRIKMLPVAEGSEAEAFNLLLAAATGEWLALLDTCCEMAPHALYLVAEELSRRPDAEIIYGDEDRIDAEGRRCAPNFKPDWNPDLLRAHHYFGSLVFYRSERLRQQGGFQAEAGAALSWELALRLSGSVLPVQIRHIPQMLCHRSDVSTQYAPDAAAEKQVLQAYLQRKGIRASVTQGRNGYWRIRYALPATPPLISIIIPTRNGLDLLAQCVKSVLNKTAYAPYEIIVVDNQSDDGATLEYLRQLERNGSARVLSYDAPFNYSALNNFAVNHARGEYLCLLNNDIEAIHPDWLEELVSQAARPEAGAVGAMLYYPDGSVQHAGVLLKGSEVATHFFFHMPAALLDTRPRAQMVQSLSAVTAACLVVEKRKYLQVGGMDENLAITCNDIDLCLKLSQAGYRNIWTPFAELNHYESATRGFDDSPAKQARIGREKAYMYERWGSALDNDPAYNPNLDLERESYALAFPPRM